MSLEILKLLPHPPGANELMNSRDALEFLSQHGKHSDFLSLLNKEMALEDKILSRAKQKPWLPIAWNDTEQGYQQPQFWPVNFIQIYNGIVENLYVMVKHN